jgi:CxxC-x17-CxxC domain-containing protein
MFEDKVLKCVDCGCDFTFTAGEQEFYQEKGFQTPLHCKECCMARKNRQKEARPTFEIVCAECGKTDTVPFRPKDDGRPVYCKDCFASKKQ